MEKWVSSNAADVPPLSVEERQEWYRRGYQAWQDGDVEQAGAHFAFLTLLDPQQPEFTFAFACVLKQQQSYAQAMALFASALQQDNAWAAFHYGECALALGDSERARAAFGAARELCFPDHRHDRGYNDLRLRVEDQLTALNG